jgi:hypothetical protein
MRQPGRARRIPFAPVATKALLLVALTVAVGCDSGRQTAGVAGTHAARGVGFATRPPSAVQTGGGAVSVFPAPGTPTASPKSEISIRGIAPGKIGAVRVVGSRSGRHAGRLVAHRDGAGASFVPATPFAAGETVRVTTHLRVRGVEGGAYTFTVLRPGPDIPKKPASPAKKPTGTPQTFVSRPDIAISRVRIDKGAPTAAGGLVFVAPRRGIGMDGLELLDGNAQLVWFRPLPKGVGATDFRPETYHGRPVLTWWEGKSSGGHGYGVGRIFDTSYRPVATVHAGNGYQADLHEFELTGAGTAFVTIYRVVRADLRSVGGPADGLVLDGVAQEVEVGTGRVLFEWHSLGSVPLSDSYQNAPKTSHEVFDYFHINSVGSDGAGNVLVSGRATHTLYELDPRTAAMHWRLGGKRSTLTVGDGVAFHSQHDAKWIGPTTISLFDNGAGVGGNRHPSSRAIVLHVDRDAGKATLLQAFVEPHGRLFASQGNIEQLPNGDWFVGWGEGSYATQFAADGRVRLDLAYASGSSYRAYRAPWAGRPTDVPAAAVTHDDGLTVHVSWNGATAVARWQVLAGPTSDALAPTGKPVRRAGFETAIALASPAAFVAVEALDASGRVLARSRPVQAA